MPTRPPTTCIEVESKVMPSEGASSVMRSKPLSFNQTILPFRFRPSLRRSLAVGFAGRVGVEIEKLQAGRDEPIGER